MININEDYLKCYRFCDSKFRLLSIFGKYSNNKLLIWVLTTSNKDLFSRKEAKRLFASYISYREGDEVPEVKPQTFTIPATSASYKRDFVDFCRSNYLIKQTFELLLINKLIKVDVYFNRKNQEATVNNASMRIKPLSMKQIEALVRIQSRNQATKNVMPNSPDEFNQFFNPKGIDPGLQ